MTHYNKARLTYTVNHGTDDAKSVQAFSPKQAAVCLCKGGQPRGGYVTHQGIAHCDNADIAVSWKRYNQLLTSLTNAHNA